MANDSFKIKKSINLEPQSSAPSAPGLGDCYCDASGKLQRWTGSAWQVVPTTASEVPNVPAGNVTTTTVQAAINEVQSHVDTNTTNIATNATTLAAATSANTPSTLVKRDVSGNFSAGTITASLVGNVTGNASGTAASITGALSGDVTSTGMATTIAAGAVTDAKVASGISASKISGNISGNAANVTGTVAVANGGTGATTQQAAINALTGTQGAGKYLRSDGTNSALSTIQAGDVPTLNQNTTGTAGNVTGTVAIANGGTGATTQQAAIDALAGTQSAGKYLRSDGTHTTLSTIAAGDVPTLNQNTTGTAANVTGIVAANHGGTGLDMSASSGLVKVSSGAFSAATLVNADISATAAIALSKLGQSGATTSQAIVWNGTAWVPGAAGGSGVGAKNYIANYNFEANTTSGWSLSHTTLDASKFPNQVSASWTSAAANLSVSTVASGQLAGSYSMQLQQVTTASTAGDMLISDAFTIDQEDQAKVMAFKFYYKVASGTGSFTGKNDGTYAVWLYDVTNSAWIQPAGVYNLVQSSGVGIAQGTFQTPSNGSQFRIAIVNITATSGAITMLFDDFYVGPQSLAFGPAMTDWQSYTPTFTGWGTATGINFFWRRVGSDVEIRGYFTAGTTTATEARISLPSGITSADITSIPAIMAAGQIFSAFSSTTFFDISALIEPSVTYLTVGIQSSGANATAKANGNAIASTGQLIMVKAKLPAQGYSSSTAMSADTDTRVCAAKMAGTTGATYTSASTTVIPYNTVVGDTHGMASTSASTITVSQTGWYTIGGSIIVNGGTSTASGLYRIDAYVNGVSKARVANLQTTASVAIATAVTGCTDSVYLNAGDVVDLRFTGSFASGTLTFDNTTTVDYFTVRRTSGPAVVAASESVNGRYYNATATLSGTDSPVTWSNKDYDSHGAYSGTTVTIPVSGKYDFCGQIDFNCTATAAGNSIKILLYKNGTSVNMPATQTQYQNSGITGGFPLQFNFCGVNCNAGDTVVINASSAATGPTIISNNSFTYLAWKRAGN